MYCSNCGSGLAVAAEACHACGGSCATPHVKVMDPPRRKTHSLDLYEAIVGPTHKDYYLSRFSRYSETGQIGLSWHWPSFFLTLPWLVYRKMWLCAAVYFFLPYASLTFGSTTLAAVAKATGMGDILVPVGLVAWTVGYLFLPPLLANGVYFEHCRDMINEAVAESPSKDRQIGALSVRGGTNRPLAILVAFFCMAWIGILAVATIPAYERYMGQAQFAHAEQYGRAAADAVAAFYMEHERLPESLDQTGFKVPIPQAVAGISMDLDDGTLTIGILSEIDGIKGGRLVLTPSLNEAQEVIWSCWSDGIASAFSSENCASEDGSN